MDRDLRSFKKRLDELLDETPFHLIRGWADLAYVGAPRRDWHNNWSEHRLEQIRYMHLAHYWVRQVGQHLEHAHRLATADLASALSERELKKYGARIASLKRELTAFGDTWTRYAADLHVPTSEEQEHLVFSMPESVRRTAMRALTALDMTAGDARCIDCKGNSDGVLGHLIAIDFLGVTTADADRVHGYRCVACFVSNGKKGGR